MSVLPPGRQPQPQPSKDKDSPREARDGQKPFNMPKRKEGKKEGEGEKEELKELKKKGLFDINPDDTLVQSKQQGLQQAAQEIAAEKKMPAIAALDQVKQINQIIARMVDSMQIGKAGEVDFVSLNLKNEPDVPKFFANCTLNISYEQNGIKIHFDNFMSPQDQNSAITLVEKNKEQLETMVQNLAAKGVQVTELMLGNHSVALPRVQALPPPFQAKETEQPEGGKQQGREGGGQREEGPKEGRNKQR